MPGLEKMQISREDIYISNKFSTVSYVFLYAKSHNFPPNGQISHEGASQIDSPLFPTGKRSPTHAENTELLCHFCSNTNHDNIIFVVMISEP